MEKRRPLAEIEYNQKAVVVGCGRSYAFLCCVYFLTEPPQTVQLTKKHLYFGAGNTRLIMRVLLLMVVATAVLCTADAKRKRKFDGDFEFAEEVRQEVSEWVALCGQ